MFPVSTNQKPKPVELGNQLVSAWLRSQARVQLMSDICLELVTFSKQTAINEILDELQIITTPLWKDQGLDSVLC